MSRSRKAGHLEGVSSPENPSPRSDPPPSAARSSTLGNYRPAAIRWLGLAIFFAALAVTLTWPLAQALDEGIGLGTEKVATVPLFNLWTLAWNVESASRGYAGYWQAPIFHPAPYSFALSEPQPVLGWIAIWICAFGASVLTAYNLLLISALAVNGLLATAFLRQIGLEMLPAVAGGVLVTALPFSHQELGVLQLVPLGGILALAMAGLRFAGKPDWRSGLLMGLATALAYGLSSQIAVFGVLSLAPAFLWLLWPYHSDRRAWACLCLGIATFGILVSPMVAAQLRATDSEGFVRSTETVRKHSALPEQYLKSPWPSYLTTPGIETAGSPSSRAFWPGTSRVLTALVALAFALRSACYRRLGVAALLLSATSILLSFGGHLQLAGLSWVELTRPLPGLGQIRSYFRFALFAQLGVMLLSAGALQLALLSLKRRLSPPIATVLAAVLALIIALDGLPTMGEIEPLPSPELHLPWLDWIEQQTGPDDVLAFVPFPTGRSSKAYLGTSQWMFWQQ